MRGLRNQCLPPNWKNLHLHFAQRRIPVKTRIAATEQNNIAADSDNRNHMLLRRLAQDYRDQSEIVHFFSNLNFSTGFFPPFLSTKIDIIFLAYLPPSAQQLTTINFD